jgi:hypothetical protein
MNFDDQFFIGLMIGAMILIGTVALANYLSVRIEKRRRNEEDDL